MSEERTPIVGEHVVFCDSSSVDHDALVTVVHGPYCVNLLYVSGNEKEQDQYGRQINRQSSVPIGRDGYSAHGMYFRYPDQPRIQYREPIAR